MMTRQSLQIIALLVLLHGGIGTLRAQGDVNLTRLTQAVNAINEGDLAQAEQLLNAVLATSRNDADALNLLGVVRAKQSRTAEAERLFRRALTSSPSHVSAHINLGELYLTTNRPAQALQVLLQAHKLAPDRPDVNANLAILYAAIANQKTQNSFSTLYTLGVINATLKQYEKAEEQFSAALVLKPDDVSTLRALARVARTTGKLEKSLAHLVHARRLAPKDRSVLYDFGATTLDMDLFLDALPVFQQLHREYPREPAYLYALAVAHWKKGEPVETTRLMNSYVARQPRDPAGHYLLGAALLRQDSFLPARTALERSLSLKPEPDTEYLLALALEKSGNRTRAIELLQNVIRARPEHAAAFSALGSAYRETGNYNEARTALERAIALDANDLRANYQLGLVYAKLGDSEAAKRMFARADDLRGQQRNQESVILKLIDPPQN